MNSIDGVAFEEIYELFANSPYGQKLRGAIRFGAYKPKEVTNEEWVEVLGPDVDNLEHLLVTLGIARDFIRLGESPHESWIRENKDSIAFDEGEKEMLCLMAVIHDWGESVVGDILWHRKTSAHEEEELKAVLRIIDELCNGKYENGLLEKMRQAIETVFYKGEEKLSRAFNVVEHVGYGRTAIRAWEKHSLCDSSLSHSLSGIAAKLIENYLPDWRGKAEVYPAMHYFLLTNERLIHEIIEAKIDWRSIPGFDA